MLSAGPLLISLSSHINPARSHATVLSPIINRFLNRDLCLDLKNTHPHVCVCVGQSVPSGVIHCEPTVWCIWETPLCFQKGIFHFAAKHFRKVQIAPVFFGGGGGFLYLPGHLRFLDTSGHFAKRLWWSCFIAGEAWRPFVLCFVLFRGGF